MKKIILTLIAVLGFAFTSSAQKGIKQTTKQSKEVTKVVKKEPVKVKAESTVVLKKDGTPDKRYTKKKTVVLKKDGTPDKRYK